MIYIVYKQVNRIPLGANYAPLVADLFLFCYESECMKTLAKSNGLNLIEKFNNTYRYLDDLCSLDNTSFQTDITNIYPKEHTSSALVVVMIKLRFLKLSHQDKP